MHPNSLKIMRDCVAKYAPPGAVRVLDVGSGDVNGTYRELFTDLRFRYVGIDIAPGKNVDIVMRDEDHLPEGADGEYDMVISGQCFEHARHPWLLACEMGRVCGVGGIVIVIAPWRWNIHRYPLDCWRILPDGMRVLLDEFAKCDVLKVGTSEDDCFGVGRRRDAGQPAYDQRRDVSDDETASCLGAGTWGMATVGAVL